MIKCVFTGAQVVRNGSVHASDIYQMPSGVLILRLNPSVIPDRLVQASKLVELEEDSEYDTWFEHNNVIVAEYSAVKFNKLSLSYAEQNGMFNPLRGDSCVTAANHESQNNLPRPPGAVA